MLAQDVFSNRLHMLLTLATCRVYEQSPEEMKNDMVIMSEKSVADIRRRYNDVH